MIRWELGGVAMNGDFPRTVDAIDNEWLSEVLGAEVTSFSTENLEGGVLSDAFRLHDIAYAGPTDGAPPSVVVKLPNAVPARRESAVASGAYAKELNFFRELACEVPIRTPTMYAVHSDLRADNIFRTDPALGRSVEDSELTYIDWQLVTAGPPGPEFTQAWQHSLPPEVRRKDRAILRQYHQRLVELNPAASAYTYEMLLQDYLFKG